MIVVINGPGGYRDEPSSIQRDAGAALFIATAVTVGFALGLLLSAVGRTVGDAFLLVFQICAGCVVVTCGVLEVFGLRPPLPQFDRETPYALLSQPYGVRVAGTSALLALGVTTRVGFTTVILVPILAVVAAQPLVGAVGCAVYAATRASLSMYAVYRARQKDIALGMLAQFGRARVASGAFAVLVGVQLIG